MSHNVQDLQCLWPRFLNLYYARAMDHYQYLSEERPVSCLIHALWWGHGSLDGQASNVLPSFLQERDEVVDGQHDVGDQLVLGHADVADGDTHAENLLQLELYGGLDIGDLLGETLVVGDWCWELAGYINCQN
jgi:hypothetical protein